MTTIYDFKANMLSGQEKPLADFKGNVLLVVNTASKCGFTPQYAGLEQLYKDMHDRGFSILGFPCNQFGKQEPGGAEEIGGFCQVNYGVSFPMFAKIDVNGDNAHPVYKYLKREKPGIFGTENIKWNFTKFLVDRNGAVVARFAPTTAPQSLRQPIQQLL